MGKGRMRPHESREWAVKPLLTVAGRLVEVDPGGTDEGWETADQETCPDYVQHEIASRILDNRLEQCASYRGLNGLHYRWRVQTPPPVITGSRAAWRGSLTLSLVIGVVLGCVLSMGGKCFLAWRAGESVDPRCMYAWQGYVEMHQTFDNVERVGCEYRPDIVAGLSK